MLSRRTFLRAAAVAPAAGLVSVALAKDDPFTSMPPGEMPTHTHVYVGHFPVDGSHGHGCTCPVSWMVSDGSERFGAAPRGSIYMMASPDGYTLEEAQRVARALLGQA